jgi:RHS repeat-associated protein
MLLLRALAAQGQEDMAHPRVAGTFNNGFTFTETLDTRLFHNDMGQPSNDVFFRFTITRAMCVVVCTCGSEVSDTYLHLLDATGNEIAYNDDEGGCEYDTQARLEACLAPGTYYAVSEGYDENGNITTSIQGRLPLDNLSVSPDKNYIVTLTPLVPTTEVNPLYTSQCMQNIQYFDGLGRPEQTVQRGASPAGGDLVAGVVYDNSGRESQQWLPGIKDGNNGAYITDYQSRAVSANGGDAKPYATTLYEASPLNRVTGRFGPGSDWYAKGKFAATGYGTNAGSEVKLFYVLNDRLACNGYYDAGTLYKLTTTDEDGHTVEEFTDKQGRKVLTRMAGDHYTYYVYDDLDNQRYVLPPLAADALGGTATWDNDNDALKKYAYIYTYDSRKRCIAKRLPGCDWIYMVYDQADRLVASQDGNQRPNNKWTVNKYDIFGRLLYSCEVVDSSTPNDMWSHFSQWLVVESFTTGQQPYPQGDTGYSKGFYHMAPTRLLTVNYYDDYRFLNLLPSAVKQNLQGYGTPNTKTLLTGTRVYHLDDPTKYETTAIYYDQYGRVTSTYATNHLGGYDKTTNSLDFRGKTIQVIKNHTGSASSPAINETYTYAYDNMERPLSVKHRVDNNPVVTLVSNTYDDLGRLQTKNLGGVDATTYGYNVRSWITGITGSHFTENLYYNNNTANLANFTGCYNGNISAMKWSIPADNIGADRAYNFTYDALNRLSDADYSEWKNNVRDPVTPRAYGEYFTFDKHGNITSLSRQIQTPDPETVVSVDYDDFSFRYNGNQRVGVSSYGERSYFPFYGDEGIIFLNNTNLATRRYDANGNATYDLNSDVYGIRYNLLNLPDTIQFNMGHQTAYTYSASGAKLRVTDKTAAPNVNVPFPTTVGQVLKTVPTATATVTDYAGNMVYENGVLKKILTPTGYYNTGDKLYYYFLKDHLGSNRVVMNQNGGIVERNHYYPSGQRFGESIVAGGSVQPYRHTGHEMQAMHGLNWIDNGARFRTVYDGGSFPTADPLMEKYPWISPYAYCSGNPVNRTDPTGLYDLPEVTITAPDLSKKNDNNDNDFSFTFQQLLENFNRNTPQIPRITPPTPTFNLPTNSNANNVVNTNKSDSKKDNGILQNISDALTAVGIAVGSFEVAVKNEAGKEIVYVTMKGTEAAVQSAKVLSVLRGIGTATIVLGIAVDVTRSIIGDPNQSWTKTGVNTCVAIVAGVIGGGPGLLIGATYYIVDNTIGWDRVLTPASNDQWIPNRAVFPDGTSVYVCFKAGTKILSKAGLKPIEQICIGDSVYSYNLDKNSIELNKVLKSFERKTQGIYELTTANQKILVTAEHPFYVEGKGWVKVKNIEVGEVLKTKNGSIERVTNIKSENYEGNVYNIEVEGNHNYFVTSSNILVHNK